MHTATIPVLGRARAAGVRLAPALVLLAAASVVAACGGSRAARPAEAAPAQSPDQQGQRVGRVEELFVGRWPGVQVFQTPAGGITVRVRGAASIAGSTPPLYVVDGQPIEVGTEGLVGVNPADIARIEVLKDPAALAEYGVRGGNGVVKITTKRGRAR